MDENGAIQGTPRTPGQQHLKVSFRDSYAPPNEATEVEVVLIVRNPEEAAQG